MDRHLDILIWGRDEKKGHNNNSNNNNRNNNSNNNTTNNNKDVFAEDVEKRQETEAEAEADSFKNNKNVAMQRPVMKDRMSEQVEKNCLCSCAA